MFTAATLIASAAGGLTVVADSVLTAGAGAIDFGCAVAVARFVALTPGLRLLLAAAEGATSEFRTATGCAASSGALVSVISTGDEAAEATCPSAAAAESETGVDATVAARAALRALAITPVGELELTAAPDDRTGAVITTGAAADATT
ncbi:MAG: hypothetical protein WBE09_04580, partial [Candidatus Acidiferrales bacterium]